MALKITDYVQVIIGAHRVEVRMQCLKWQKLSLNVYMYIYKYIFSEKGRRGGISCISDRHSKAKNKYLKSYDPKHELKHRYLDANNL